MNQIDQLAANIARIAEQARIAGDRLKRLEEMDNWLRGRGGALARENILMERQRDKLAGLMRESVENCETCRGETEPKRRCARCQTFTEALAELEAPKETANAQTR